MQQSGTVKPDGAEVKLATWNVEHLAYPFDTGCKPRTEQQVQQLKVYAESLDVDIIALQEVASVQAISLLFPPDKWQIFISPRENSEAYECRGSGNTSTQQKVAFAVRKPLQVNAVTPVAELGLNSAGLRFGLALEVSSELGTLSLLNVHLKSGCFVDNLRRSDRESCQTLTKQAPVLDQWIDHKERQGKQYAVLGDFNHRLTAPYNQLLRELSSDKQGGKRSLVNTGAQLIGCHPYYPAPIDHIFIGNFDLNKITYQTKIEAFQNMEVEAMLSDHCAVTASLKSTTSRP
jgi:endonuclease/exonuclease/phosphatase family metal-dependent hydrolase